MFHWRLHAFTAPRQGYNEREYEDAWDRFPRTRESGPLLRVALADGATTSSFAREWAQALTRAFVQRNFLTEAGLGKAVQVMARAWWLAVFSRPLPWYAEEKARRGAFASLLGVQIEASRGDEASGHWQALAVGDSCLFLVRGAADDHAAIQTAFPLQKAEEFGDSPALLSSLLARNSQVPVRALAGQWQAGDLFVLATDALAAWFLAEIQQGQQPWQTLAALPDQPAFDAWLRDLRASGRIRNDDTTCILIRVHKFSSFRSDDRA